MYVIAAYRCSKYITNTVTVLVKIKNTTFIFSNNCIYYLFYKSLIFDRDRSVEGIVINIYFQFTICLFE